jgi:tetratricopeptide (TPR) repeat protein
MTSKQRTFLRFAIAVFSINLIIAVHAADALTSGQPAPSFTLEDIDGQAHTLVEAKGRQMTVLFFFDVTSHASQEGLLMLDKLLKQYADKQLTVWGIARSTRSAVQEFKRKAHLAFPILLDTADVSRKYNARTILPVVCTLGPDLKVLDFFQGGGKTAEVMLVRLAERQLHRNRPDLAKAIGAEVAKKDPDNLQAKIVQGYAALQQGQTTEAGRVFEKIAEKPGKGAIAGKEGQAAVLSREGKVEKALALVDEVIKKAPQQSAAHKLRGDLLAGKGDIPAAQAAYEKAVRQPEAAPFQKAEAYNQLGRIYAQQGRYAKARSLFDDAVKLDPYYLEPTSNKGVTYEKEGLWTRALSEYRKAVALNPTDTIATVLSRKAEQMLALQADKAGKERMDRLVNDLVKRYKSAEKAAAPGSEDDWTSRPMVLTFVDLQEKGGLAARDGLAIVLATRLGELLNESGRVRVVERAVMERLLSELNLGSSELVDPDTALRLGKLLATKLIGTGSLIYMPDSTLLNLRLIDTETSAIAKTITRRIGSSANLERELDLLNRDILKTIVAKYPLQGYVVQADTKEVILNLGSKQGVSTGTRFEVFEAGKPITYKGKVLSRAPHIVARLEVRQVESGLCYARIVEQKRPLKQDDQVKEVFPEMALKGRPNG